MSSHGSAASTHFSELLLKTEFLRLKISFFGSGSKVRDTTLVSTCWKIRPPPITSHMSVFRRPYRHFMPIFRRERTSASWSSFTAYATSPICRGTTQAQAEHCRRSSTHQGGAGFAAIVHSAFRGPDLHPHVKLMTRIVLVSSPFIPSTHTATTLSHRGCPRAAAYRRPITTTISLTPDRKQSTHREMKCTLLGETPRRCPCGGGTYQWVRT
jgi:hypothetical protein